MVRAKYKPLPFARHSWLPGPWQGVLWRVWDKFGQYFKPEGFHYCKPAGLWWPICSRIQLDLTEFHQGNVIQEISLFLHLCVAVLSGPVDWHWLWGIAISNNNQVLIQIMAWCPADSKPLSEWFWLTGAFMRNTPGHREGWLVPSFLLHTIIDMHSCNTLSWGIDSWQARWYWDMRPHNSSNAYGVVYNTLFTHWCWVTQ